jgi:hypothetical protein
MGITRFISYLLLVASVLMAGCFSPSKPTPDPLAGFHVDALFTPESNKAIADDYQDYMHKLSLSGPISTFKDDTGQRAIQIHIGVNGEVWEHVLIYDKNNKRIKTIKYMTGHYAS